MLDTHFVATVEFGVNRLICDLANDLNKVLGCALSEEKTGQFDEIPAFVGHTKDVSIILFGPTEEYRGRGCVLEISYSSELTPEEARCAAPTIFRSVFFGTYEELTGYINCSVELEGVLRGMGFSDCHVA